MHIRGANFMNKLNFKVLILAVWVASAGLIATAYALGPFDVVKKCVEGPDCTRIDGGACINFHASVHDKACFLLMTASEPPKCPVGTQPCNKCAKDSAQGKCGKVEMGYLAGCKDIIEGSGEWHHMKFQRDADARCTVLCCPGNGGVTAL
jgi:hypothetical protein